MNVTGNSLNILTDKEWNTLLPPHSAILIGISPSISATKFPFDVYVTHLPFDSASVFVPLFAAFFGAAAAFALNWFNERIRKRQSQHDLINSSVYALIITLNTLLSFKKQYLYNFEIEFAKARNLLAQMNPSGDQQSFDEIGRNVVKIFSEISKRDETLNGVFKVWEEIQFLNLTSPEDLAFTVEAEVDLVRLLMVARSQIYQVSKRITDRNVYRKEKVDGTLEDARAKKIGPNTLLFWYEMLDSRTTVCAHVDTALVVIAEALDQLERFRKKHFKERNKFSQFAFGRERWTSYKLPEKWREFMPDKNSYKDVIEGSP